MYLSKLGSGITSIEIAGSEDRCFIDGRHLQSPTGGMFPSQHPLLIKISSEGQPSIYRIEDDMVQPGQGIMYSHILNPRYMPDGRRSDLLDGATRFRTGPIDSATVLEGKTGESIKQQLDDIYRLCRNTRSPIAS